MKRQILILLTIIIYISQCTLSVLAVSDRDILSDKVMNYYEGTQLGKAMIQNINFTDVVPGYWARESITRLGALSVIKGYGDGYTKKYRPSQIVSKQETLAFLLRVIGQEETAMKAAEQLVTDDSLLTIWSKGYLQVAANLGLITQAELADGLVADQTLLDSEFNFIRGQATTREEVAKWIVEAVNIAKPDTIKPVYTYNKILTMGDWGNIGNEYTPYVEAVMLAGIMVGDGKNFNPKGELTRAEMAQMIVNIDDILYDTMGLELKAGVIGSIKNSVKEGSVSSETIRTILIRNDKGLVDQVDVIYTTKNSKLISDTEVPVYRETGVSGISSLNEEDNVEYLVNPTTNEIVYIYVKGTKSEKLVKGILQPLVDIKNGKITIENTAEVPFTYQLVDGLYNNENNTLKIGYEFYPMAEAPVANTITLTLKNNIVTHIAYEGGISLANEVSGIVKDINLAFGFITIQDWQGNEVTRNFNKDKVEVEKEYYYDVEDEIGYIDEMFPNYEFDDRDTNIDDIEVGDIVHLLMGFKNPTYISRISGKTNYSVKFGEIVEINNMGGKGLTIRLSYGDTTIGTLDVEANIPVIISGTNIGTSKLEVGDMVKVLINQGVVAPGQIIETVKYIEVDPYGNIMANIYKGELGYINHANQTIDLLNNYRLTKVGWGNYTQQTKLEIPEERLEVYYHGEPISLSYAENYLGREGMIMYVVTERYHTRERIAKIVFEEGQEAILPSGTISYSNGHDTLKIVGEAEAITTDSGTIVVKDNHIVSTSSLLAPDYAQIITGNMDIAVVVHIRPEPKNDAISVFRGRIASIIKGNQVTVASNALLKDMTWIYSPVERIYTLSYDTKIIDENGIQSLDEFIDYSEISKVDEVYTIIAEGTKATYLVKNPYATGGVSGEIYNIDEDGIISIKSALVYNSLDKLWKELSYTNNYAQVETAIETVIIKNNKVISVDELEIGDEIRGMITVDLAEQLKTEDNRKATAYIIFVEN